MIGAAPIQRERRPIPLNCLVGRSPQNCRQGDGADDDVEGLAASIAALAATTGEGLINPLLVGPAPGAALRWHVHAGGRRLAAMRRLVDAGTFAPDRPVDCIVFGNTFDEREIAREISLVENTMRRDLHPVEQCDAFEALCAHGLEVERIAADFALPVRQVRQRLRLTKLSPRVRDLWRAGRMNVEQAQAFAIGQSHAAQDELLDRIERTLPAHHPANIRTELLHAAKAVPFHTREALYVGLDAYVAAGGHAVEDLFADVPLIFDEALLKRLAREQMMREGEAILQAEGWSFCYALEDVAAPFTWERIKPELTGDERARLDAIQDEGEALANGDDPATQAALERLEAEEHAIEARGFTRAATPARRAKAGILVAIDHKGCFTAERGVVEPDDRQPAEAPTPHRPVAPATPAPEPTKPAKPADPIEAAAGGLGQVRAILDETVGKALVEVVSARPDLALMFAVARFGGTFSPDTLERDFGMAPANYSYGKPSTREGLLGRLDAKSFVDAIALCADTPLGDLTVAFAAIAARSIRLDKHSPLSGLAPVARAFARRGATLGPAFRAAFDAERYFDAASKAACLAALEAMAVPAVDKSAKKPALAAQAAAAAKAQGWLPFPLADWAGVEASSPEAYVDDDEAPAAPPPTTLAQAMGGAIADDELRREIGLLTFLTLHIGPVEGRSVRCADLFSAYRNNTAAGSIYGRDDFNVAMWALGFDENITAGTYPGFDFAAAVERETGA